MLTPGTVAVVRDLRVPAWSPKLADATQLPKGPILSIDQALATRWDSDALLQQVVIAGIPGQPRLSKKSVPLCQQSGIELWCGTFVYDLDLNQQPFAESPDKQPWTAETLAEFGRRVHLLCERGPHPRHVYTTPHGARLIYVPDEAVPVERFERAWRSLGERIAATSGLVSDPACSDWSRMFRLPRIPSKEGGYTDEKAWFRILSWQDKGIIDWQALPEPTIARALFAPVPDEMPDPDHCERLVFVDGSAAELTEIGLKVRKALMRSPTKQFCFLREPFHTQNRNQLLTSLIGGQVRQLFRTPGATPEVVFGLWIHTCRSMEPDDRDGDWVPIVWSMIDRFWRNEQARHSKALESQGDFLDQLYDTLAAGGIDLPERDKATQKLQQFFVLSDGRSFYVLQPDCTWSSNPTSSSTLVPAVRDGIGVVFPSVLDMAPSQFLRECVTEVPHVVGVAGKLTSTLRLAPQGLTLELGLYSVNPDIVPQWDPEIDQWLRLLAYEPTEQGDPDADRENARLAYSDLMNWLGRAVILDSRVPALCMIGSAGSGKTTLMNALTQCFTGGVAAGPEVLVSDFHDALEHTPVVHFDEGIPFTKYDKSRVSEGFRRMVTSAQFEVNRKFAKKVQIQARLRVAVSANSFGVFDLFRDEGLSPDDVAAIMRRIILVQPGQSAARYLRETLARRDNAKRWMQGGAIARHIMAIGQQMRVAIDAGDAPLDMPEGNHHEDLLRILESGNDRTYWVVRAVCRLWEDVTQRKPLVGLPPQIISEIREGVSRTGDDTFLVAPASLFTVLCSLPNYSEAGRLFRSVQALRPALTPLAVRPKPQPLPSGVYGMEIDMTRVRRHAVSYGVLTDNTVDPTPEA